MLLASSAATVVLSTWLTRKNVAHASKQVISQIEELNERKRRDIQSYILETFIEAQSRSNALLMNIEDQSDLKDLFFNPTPLMMRLQPMHTSLMLATNKWLDFAQSSLGQNSFLIKVDAQPLLPIHLYPTVEGVKTFIAPIDGVMTLLIGIPFMQSYPTNKQGEFLDALALGAIYKKGCYIIYKVEDLLQNKGQNPFIPSVLFNESLMQYRQDYEKTALLLDQQFQYLKPWEQKAASAPLPSSMQREKSKLIRQSWEEYERFWKLSLAWKLSLLWSHIPPERRPLGIAQLNHDGAEGRLLLWSHVVDNAPLLPVEGSQKSVGPFSVELFQSSESPHLFLASSLTHETNSLSIGTDLSSTLKLIAISLQQNIAVVAKETIVSLYNSQGEPLPKEVWPSFAFSSIQKETSGVIEGKSETYFFMKVAIGGIEGAYFFIFSPFKESFAFVDKLNTTGAALSKALQLHQSLLVATSLILLLLAINWIITHVTKPLSDFAHATESIGKGDLAGNDLHPPNKDGLVCKEVEDLYEATSHMVEQLREKEKIRSVLNKVVSPEIAEEILKNNLKLGGELRQVSMLFADVRGFTSLAATMRPNEVVAMLNSTMDKLCPIVEEYRGVVDKFIGDQIMALFGAPLPMQNSIQAALDTALDMIAATQKWNVERVAQGLAPIQLGISVHHGIVVAGNMGAQDRLNYTVVGSEVNLGARLCTVAGPDQVIVTDAIFLNDDLQTQFKFTSMGATTLKGIQDQVPIYSVTRLK